MTPLFSPLSKTATPFLKGRRYCIPRCSASCRPVPSSTTQRPSWQRLWRVVLSKRGGGSVGCSIAAAGVAPADGAMVRSTEASRMPKAWVVTVRRWVGLGGSRNERRISGKTETGGIHGRRHASPLKYNFYESAPSTKNPRLSPGVLRLHHQPISSIRQRPSWPRPGIPRSGRSSCSGRSPHHWR